MAKFLPFGGKKKYDLSKMPIEDIEAQVWKLENESNFMSGEIEKLRSQRDENFKRGINSTPSERKILSQRILNIEGEIENKNAMLDRTLKQIKSLRKIVDARKRGVETNIMKQYLENTDMEALNIELGKSVLAEEKFDRRIGEFERIGSIAAERKGSETDKETEKLMEQWDKLEKESGTLFPTKTKLSKESTQTNETENDAESEER